MDKATQKELRSLQSFGWEVDKQPKVVPNYGSESYEHWLAKAITARIGLEYDYRVDSEVSHPTRGELDLLFWGHPARITYAVEVEVSPKDETIEKKIAKYVDGPIQDLLWVNVSGLPVDRIEAKEYCLEELGL